VSPALHAFLTGLIDYAGLFPPAKLPLDEALGRFINDRASPDAWMLSRFVCPAARLAELAAFEDLIARSQPFAISALARTGGSVKDFPEGLQADLEAIDACRKRFAGRVVVDSLEVRLPIEYNEAFLLARIRLAGKRLASSWDGALFFELSNPTPEALAGLLGHLLREADFTKPAGFKLRTGGLAPAAFPSCEQVAFALVCCAKEGILFKATAGLHHPFRHFDSAIGAHMHGFVNVFAAGILGHAHQLEADQLRPILEDSNPAHFRFDDHGLHWRELSASTEAVALARRQAMLSFGSCSFDEPRDELRALGWL
jgi:hypothetical protein